MLITVTDFQSRKEIRSFIDKEQRVKEVTYEKVISEKQTGSIVKLNRNAIAEYHDTQMEDYYESAENTLQRFWGKETPFYRMFMKLDISNVVELACGHGRHLQMYYSRAGSVTLVDVLEKNIIFCKKRFASLNKVFYYVNNGYDLSDLKTGSYSSLFCYDAMVHFELLDIFNYLKETFRILCKGGMALFHHSNNTSDYRITFMTGELSRNYMSKDIFAYLANRACFSVVEQELYDYGNDGKFLDCISLLKKE